ncbi:hypothetical protein GW17_00032101 [Ensete ventricosum]|nr:hypothetical protein GW17_00032101 [Ensete ventricosum]
MRGQSSEFLEFIGAGSSFSPKDALTPLSPNAPSPSSLPLPAGNHPAKAPTGGRAGRGRRAASGCAHGCLPPLRAGRSRPCSRAGAALAGAAGLAVGSWPPLRLATFAAKI